MSEHAKLAERALRGFTDDRASATIALKALRC